MGKGKRKDVPDNDAAAPVAKRPRGRPAKSTNQPAAVPEKLTVKILPSHARSTRRSTTTTSTSDSDVIPGTTLEAGSSDSSSITPVDPDDDEDVQSATIALLGRDHRRSTAESDYEGDEEEEEDLDHDQGQDLDEEEEDSGTHSRMNIRLQ